MQNVWTHIGGAVHQSEIKCDTIFDVCSACPGSVAAGPDSELARSCLVGLDQRSHNLGDFPRVVSLNEALRSKSGSIRPVNVDSVFVIGVVWENEPVGEASVG